jgi:nitronate monooxygenase
VADDAARQLMVEGRRGGDPAHAPLYAGEAVGLVTEERSATDVVRDLDAAAQEALRASAGLLG